MYSYSLAYKQKQKKETENKSKHIMQDLIERSQHYPELSCLQKTYIF